MFKDFIFGYFLNLTFKNEYQYYGLLKMSLGNMWSKCLRKIIITILRDNE
jgi:hypothetical protein